MVMTHKELGNVKRPFSFFFFTPSACSSQQNAQIPSNGIVDHDRNERHHKRHTGLEERVKHVVAKKRGDERRNSGRNTNQDTADKHMSGMLSDTLR
jgi:hypothetical protein